MKKVQLGFLDPHLALETTRNVKSKSIVEHIGSTDRGESGASLGAAANHRTASN